MDWLVASYPRYPLSIPLSFRCFKTCCISSSLSGPLVHKNLLCTTKVYAPTNHNLKYDFVSEMLHISGTCTKDVPTLAKNGTPNMKIHHQVLTMSLLSPVFGRFRIKLTRRKWRIGGNPARVNPAGINPDQSLSGSQDQAPFR